MCYIDNLYLNLRERMGHKSGYQKELLEIIRKKNAPKTLQHACSAPNPTPHPLLLSSPYLTLILVRIIPFSFLFTRKKALLSTHLKNQTLSHQVFPLSAFSLSRQYVPPKTPLYLLVDHTHVPTETPLYLLIGHTQRSPSTNNIDTEFG